ncbi:MAG: ABC transporter permease, partial [Vicinamibacterales bacterium]
FNGDARQLFHQLISESATIPGVDAAAWAMRLPTQIVGLRTSVAVIGESELESPATLRPVSQEYFDTAGIPLMAGRRFATTDTRDSPRVAIVNTTFVRDLLEGRSPVNLRLSTSLAGEVVTIVGVVGDVTPAGALDRPALYVSLDQLSTPSGYLIVRAKGDPRSIMPALTNRLRTTAPMIAVDRMERVAESLEDGRAVVRFSMQLAAMFAALALALSVIGVYGLTAGEVSARWRELALRLALGASRFDALWTVIKPCAVLLLAGAVLGMIGAVGAAPALASLLHGVKPVDAPTLAMAPLVLGAVGIVAAVLAARRVLKADPAAALRSE